MIRNIWQWLRRPSRLAWSVVFLLGALAMVFGLGSVHLALETTGSVEFCVSCHSMTIPYEEYKQTAHYQNTSGVRAICQDCHVPEQGIPYYEAKILAGKDLYYWALGKLATDQDYETHRLDLAEVVWAQMAKTNSRECRSCHAMDAMVIANQVADAQKMHTQALETGETCIDCHKGIAHKMPDLAARAREIAAAFMAEAQPLDADKLWAKRGSTLLAEAGAGAETLATILPGVAVTKLEISGDFVKVRISGWQAGEVVRGQYALFGQRILNLSIASSAIDRVTYGEVKYYSDGDQDWTASALEGWVLAADLTSDGAMLWSVAATTYSSQCAVCHSANRPASRAALEWQAEVQTYGPKTSLTKEEERLVLRYLQLNSWDTVAQGGEL